MNETESLCRICLREDARTPIYEDSNCESGSNSTILTKLTLCLNDKFEEAPGHPRYICDSCLDTLNMVFHFINKYKETCKILQERLEHVKEVIKLDETDEFVFPEYYTLDDGDFCPEDNTFDAFEPKEKKIKIEFEDSTCFIEKLKSICKLNTAEKSNTNKNFEEEVPHVKAKHNQLRKLKNNRKKEIVETGQDKNFIKIEFKQKTTKSFTSSYKYQTNRIMSSLLEGVFVWDGDDWSPGTLPPKNASNGELKSKNPQENDERDPQQPTKTNERMAPDPVLCPMCGKTFPNQFNLRNHVEMHTNVQCSLCNAKIVKGSLRRHMKTKHSSTKNFICNVCGKGFALYGQMDVHIKGVHEKSLPRRPKRRLPCELCDKDFITKKLLLIHGRAAHTGERPAVCTVCNASFYHEDYLKEHTRLHTGECPFECPVCGRGYPHLGNMKSHMKNHRVSELSEETLSTIKPSWFKYLRP